MSWRSAAPIALLVLGGLASGASSAERGGDETLRYRWRVKGLLRGLASLFVPSDGEGELRRQLRPDGHEIHELYVTAKASGNGDFFRYGAELDPATGTTVRAWSASRWRGESKEKEARIDQRGVIDIASGISAIRRDPPRTARQLEIWSNGKIYPVVVVPLEVVPRRLGGRQVAARHYSVRGVEKPGRPVWKGSLELWLANDAAATPVQIVVERSLAGLHLDLVDTP